MKKNGNYIYNLEAIEFLKKIKESNILADLIITDPPYNISRKNNFKTIGRSGIDFGEWDYNFDQLEWINYADSILNKKGSILIFNDWKNMQSISQKLAQLGYEIKDLITWKKTNPMPRNVNSRYVSDREFCLWATKSKKWTFNKEESEKYLRPEFIETSVIGNKRFHPTQKPIELAERLIKIHSNENDLIVDPFSGSGAFSIAAMKTNRRSLATEIDEVFYKESLKNLQENRNFTRSPLYYIGDKINFLKAHFNEAFPDNINNFYDVFAGGGSVVSNIKANKRYFNDINEHVVKVIKYLSNNKFEIIDEQIKKIIKNFNFDNSYNKANKNKESYNIFKENFNKGNFYINKEIDLLFLIIFGFNSNIRFNKKDEFNIPVGKGCYSEERANSLKEFCKKIKNVYFFSDDFTKFLSREFEENDFLYFDPPYLVSEAPYNNVWSEEKEKELYYHLDLLNEKKIRWTLSNIKNKGPVKNNILIDWLNKNNYKIINISKQYSNSNYHRKEAEVSEIIVRNW